MAWHHVLWLALVLGIGGCTGLSPLPPPEAPVALPEFIRDRAEVTYILGPDDVLSISVYGHLDLSIETPVAPDGTFMYPLLGVVPAAGRTVRQLESQLAQALAAYLVNPQVRLVVKAFQSQRVHVMGAVGTPGTYVLKRASTLLELLSAAGGPTPDAGWEVVVVRAGVAENGAAPGSMLAHAHDGAIRVDLEKLLTGEYAQSLRIANGDTIYVPKAAFFYVYGQVQRPGRYRLERDTTVAKALTVAGGMTPIAAQQGLRVQRLVAGQRQDFQAQMSDLLQVEDLLIVPESVFPGSNLGKRFVPHVGSRVIREAGGSQGGDSPSGSATVRLRGDPRTAGARLRLTGGVGLSPLSEGLPVAEHIRPARIGAAIRPGCTDPERLDAIVPAESEATKDTRGVASSGAREPVHALRRELAGKVPGSEVELHRRRR